MRFDWLPRMPREPPPPGPRPPLRRGGGDLNRASAGLTHRAGSLPLRLFAGEGLGMGGAGPSTGPLPAHTSIPKCTPSPTLFVGEGGTRVSAAG
jgi:hypothetical protein